jgi:LDH2 family malate/lactate/ureidoglycolate dehydrogenase
MMSDTTTLTIDGLLERVEAIFRKGGLNSVQAGALARVIVAGERDACKSHGIYRIEGALRTVKAGKVKPDAIPEVAEDDGTAIVKVNANGGFANPAFLGALAGSRGADRKRPCRSRDVPELFHRRPHWGQQTAARHQPLRLRLAA